MRLLALGIGLGHRRGRFAQSELQPPEQSLTLSHPEIGPENLVEPGRERLAVPHVAPKAGLPRGVPQHSLDPSQVLPGQPPRAPRTRPFGQAGQAARFKSVDPVLDGARRVTQQSRNVGTAHTVSDQEHAVQPMIVPRLLGATDLILETENDRRGVGNREGFHSSQETTSRQSSASIYVALLGYV